MYRTSNYRIKVFIGVFTAILLAFQASTVFARLNAYRYKYITNRGAYSAIVTGDPTTRPDPTGRWSYMRVAVQRIINNDVYYAEIGWLKGAQTQSNFVPRSYWTYRATDGTRSQGWG